MGVYSFLRCDPYLDRRKGSIYDGFDCSAKSSASSISKEEQAKILSRLNLDFSSRLALGGGKRRPN
jgi:hypothetical protein